MQPDALERRSRSAFRWTTAAVAAALALSLAGSAFAQLPQARLYSLFPPGGQVGTTFEVKVTSGEDTDEAETLVFGHPGIKAEPKMQEVAGESVPVENTFIVTIDGNVPEGLHEIRLKGLFGVSNPRTFAVGQREEITEDESNNDFEQANEIQLDKTVNGVLNGNADLDHFAFTGKKGQRVVVDVFGRRLDSKIDPVVEIYDPNRRLLTTARNDVRGDAVADLELPADGQYYVKLFDFVYGGGNDYFYRLVLHAGPHVDFVMPPAGQPGSTSQYTLYGRNLPGGEPSGVTLDGTELQKKTVEITLPNEPDKLDVISSLDPQAAGVDAVAYQLETPQGDSNKVLIYFATAPVVLEKEPNDEPAAAQQVELPFELAGQFQERDDVDRAAFEAKAGEVYYVEVFGHRQMNSTADPYFVLEQVTENDKGEEDVKRITAQDDYSPNIDNNRPNPIDNVLSLNSVDPMYRFQVPADGRYRLEVRDRYFESRGHPGLVYRLSVRPETPDFRLLTVPTGPPDNNQPATPGAITLRKGENVGVRIAALKRDGFDGVIDVRVEGLPKGVTAKDAVIGPGDIGTQLVLSAAEDADVAFSDVKIVGTARIVDPAKTRGIAQTKKQIADLEEDLPDLRQNADKARQELDKQRQEFDKAKQAADGKPDDENLKKQLEQAQQNLDKATAEAKKATDALAAKEKQIADATAAIEQLEKEREASAKDVSRMARAATVVWKGQNNVSNPDLRLSQSVTVSVIDEVSPFQVTTDVDRVEVNQGRQVLVPVKAFKRDGFDEEIKLSFQGLPKNANIDLQNASIGKGKDSQLLRMYVKNNGMAGAYTVYLQAQAQVKYRRNPQRVEREKERQKKIEEMLKAAQEAKKQADQTKQNADKAKQEADKAKQEADKAAEDAANKLKQAQDALQKAEAELKQKPDDEAAKKAVEEAKKQLADAEAAKKSADEAKTKAEAEAKSAAEAAKAADDAVKAADAEVKKFDDLKKKVDNDVKDAENKAKEQNVNVQPPSTPLVLVVRPAPVELSANVPGGGNLKKGENLEIKATVKRVNGFDGPVTLTLPELPDVKGLSADAVTIPADQTEGTIVVKAGGDATEGQIPNAVIRATAEFDGNQAAVDAPVTIKVNK